MPIPHDRPPLNRYGKMRRYGKSGGAITVGLFLLSGLLALPALWWAFRKPAGARPPSNYVFSSDPWAEANDNPPPSSRKINAWRYLPEIPQGLAQFETVFWEPDDTKSLREWIANEERLPVASVLEIGTGTGLISLCCVQRGAIAVATDINPNAVANAVYNAEWLGLGDKLSVRLVPAETPAPYAVVAADEKFDFIISNPPWEDGTVTQVAEHALYDPSFALLDGLLKESAAHLHPGGRLLLAYGNCTAIRRVLENAPKFAWKVQVHDDRELDSLPENFLPGMLLELTPE
jgi:release factor glutamine methyltransferase